MKLYKVTKGWNRGIVVLKAEFKNRETGFYTNSHLKYGVASKKAKTTYKSAVFAIRNSFFESELNLKEIKKKTI